MARIVGKAEKNPFFVKLRNYQTMHFQRVDAVLSGCKFACRLEHITQWGGRILLSLGVFATLIMTARAAEVGDWPAWRGADHTNRSAEQGLLTDWSTPPKLLWEMQGMGRGFASVSIVGNRLYTTGNTDSAQCVVCVDLDSQKVLWTTPFTEGLPQHDYDGSRSVPSLSEGRAYVVGSGGNIACVDANSGKLLWKHEFSEWGGRMMSGWGFSEAPLVDGDAVLCTPGGSDAMVVKLNKVTGDLIWKAKTPVFGQKKNDGAGYSSIVPSMAAGVPQYVQLIGRGVIGLDAKTGKFLWGYDKAANDVANIPTPIVDGDFVFTSTGYGAGAALLKIVKSGSGLKAQEVYFLPANDFQNHHGGMILHEGKIYAGNKHNEGFPVCLDMATGKQLWGGKRGPGKGSAAITMYDGHLVFRYQDGTVALIEATPEKYNLKGTFTISDVKDPSWSHPVISRGKLYLREQDRLLCYDLAK